jgi:hypothetical protein
MTVSKGAAPPPPAFLGGSPKVLNGLFIIGKSEAHDKLIPAMSEV